MPIHKVPVRIVHPGSGGDAYNIWHLRTVQNDQDYVVDALGALKAFYTTCKGLYPNQTQIHVGDGVIDDPYGSPTYNPYVPQTVVGTGQVAQAPQLLALVVTWRTTAATRSGRGRTFLGPLELAALDGDGTIKEAWLSEARTAAQDLMSQSTLPGGWSFGVYSHKDKVLRDFTSFTVRDRCSVLRSRRD